MTSDFTSVELKAWRDRYGFSNAQAAEKLGLTLPGFLNQLYGRRPVSRQTAKLAETLALLWLVPGESGIVTIAARRTKTR